MTFQDIQNDVADRLNLTSSQALARIGRTINIRYKWLATAIGIQAAARTTVTQAVTMGVRSVVFTNVSKIYSVFYTATGARLNELSFDLLRNKAVAVDPPTEYAIQLMGATSVTLYLGTSPASAFSLTADAEASLTELSGAIVPTFPQDYHDILIYGTLSSELEKMEKPDLAAIQEARYDKRLSELKTFMERMS